MPPSAKPQQAAAQSVPVDDDDDLNDEIPF
jgi:hypothetical protein